MRTYVVVHMFQAISAIFDNVLSIVIIVFDIFIINTTFVFMSWVFSFLVFVVVVVMVVVVVVMMVVMVVMKMVVVVVVVMMMMMVMVVIVVVVMLLS